MNAAMKIAIIKRVALTFEISPKGTEVLLGRPQDFRVKLSHWQYSSSILFSTATDGTLIAYNVYAYARRWRGLGFELSELDHNGHPTDWEIDYLVRESAKSMSGLPVRVGWEPMSWNDPLNADDFLDESDDQKDFTWWSGDGEDQD